LTRVATPPIARTASAEVVEPFFFNVTPEPRVIVSAPDPAFRTTMVAPVVMGVVVLGLIVAAAGLQPAACGSGNGELKFPGARGSACHNRQRPISTYLLSNSIR